MTSPRRFTSGPPLFPGLIEASVWMKLSKVEVGAFDGADDPCRDRLCQSEGIANGEDPLPHADRLGFSHSQGRKSFGVDFKEGQVAHGVGLDEIRSFPAHVRPADPDLFGVDDQVVVREDVASRVDHESGTDGFRRRRFAAHPVGGTLPGNHTLDGDNAQFDVFGNSREEALEFLGKLRLARGFGFRGLHRLLRTRGISQGEAHKQRAESHQRSDNVGAGAR